MQKLKELGIRIGIGTDMTAHIQYRRLEFLNLSPYIDFIVTSEEAGVEKPTPHLFELCVEKAGVPAGECAFIGDNLTKDVKGAWDNGLKGIWYTKWIEQQEEIEFAEQTVTFEEYQSGNWKIKKEELQKQFEKIEEEYQEQCLIWYEKWQEYEEAFLDYV